MKKIGITGISGFIGSHLKRALSLLPQEYEIVECNRSFFDNSSLLDSFVRECDVIVHLAAVNRHQDAQFIYDKNVQLSELLIKALERTGVKPHIIFSSSSQENLDNFYGNSKQKARELLLCWAKNVGAKFTGLIIPNVFGPFCKPNYNSFIATFCHKIINSELPEIQYDANVALIYVGDLVDKIIKEIGCSETNENYIISNTSLEKVSTVLSKLKFFNEEYINNGRVPNLESMFDLQLFNTFCTYIDHKKRYPVKFTEHVDARGTFIEVIRFDIGGQCSFSTTVVDITRGNHFHTRKIERFAVIKGKALIQLRKIDSEEIMDFCLDGDEPSYVDMPIWYTHNIKNIGDEDLYTIFWINEAYNSEDPDTYFLEV